VGDVVITFPDRVEDRDVLEAMVFDYYAGIFPKVLAVGGPELSAAEYTAAMWDDIDDFLPPKGRIALAHDATGRLVGCGFLRECAPGGGELKRLYVAPDHLGTGLGKRLVEARIAQARAMGLRAVYADTFMGNTAMLRLYDKLGFQDCDRYPGNANPDEFDWMLVYRRLDL
jgi:GNAT superfamily N-acetyltransferase